MLGNFASRACKDKCRGRGDVERVRAIAACADNIVDGFVRVELDLDRDTAHRTDRASDFRNGLAFHAKCSEIRADLRLCGLTRHDDGHRFFGFIVSEVGAIDGFGNKGFEHGLFSFRGSGIQI